MFVHCGVLSVGVRKKLGLPSPFDIRFGNPLDLHAVASSFPSVPVIIPHFGAGLFREALMVADLCPNVLLDTSSSNGWMKYADPDLTLVSKHPLLRFEVVPADEHAAEGEEGLMDIGATFVADGEAAKAMEPRVRAFDDPAEDAEAAAVRRSAPREDRDDALRAQPVAMRLGVVAAIALDHIGPAPGPAAPAADRRQRGDERIELRDVVDVGGGHLRDERDAARIGDEVVLGTRLAAIGWVRSSFFPPRTARTDALSTTVQRWSRRPRRRSSASKVSCNRCHTPVRCQRTNRRQHVLPEPQPIWRGSICQGIPDRRTNKMPVRMARSGMGVRPCRCPRRTRRAGINGASRVQIASSISSWDMPDRTKPPGSVQVGRYEF